MRKTAVVVIILAMLVSLTVVAMAEENSAPVLPGEGLYTAMQALEHAQLQISKELPEQALLENEFANRRMESLALAAENAEGFGAEVIQQLLAYLGEHEGNLGLLMAALASGKEVPVDVELLEEIEGEVNERGWRLQEIVLDESMPEGARAGAQKALLNMEAAAEKAAGEEETHPKGGPPMEVPPEAPPMEVPVGRPSLP